MDEILVKYTNGNSRFAVIDGTMVHFRDEGNGYPVVMLHGAFSSLHTFDGWVGRLKGEFRMVRYDLLGFGLTGRHAKDNYSIEAQIRILKELLNILKIDRCVLCGSSLGGWIAWEFALRYPNRLRKLVLMDAAGHLDQESIPLPFKMARTPFVNRVVKMVVRRNVLEQFVKQVYSNDGKVTPALIDRYFELFSREGNPEAFLLMVNKTKYKDNTQKLAAINVPTLILWGEDDNWIPLDNAHRFLEKIPKSRLVIYENVGHLPMEEEPEDTSIELRRFIHGGGDQSNLFYD